MPKTHIARSEQETIRLARHLAKKLSLGAVLALRGPLGSGKTTFLRGVASGLGSKDLVRSPTFTLLQRYGVPRGKFLYHLDLYRLSPKDLDSAGLWEYLSPQNGWTAIEWPQIIQRYLPKPHWEIRLEHRSPTARSIRIEVVG
ncbi:MAG: tRNA (adenosine(37)-N6)-threonylcarbamoyltransferase complex ATPase subunit type 1 TsaE [Elusimicrobia bacterium]|nr:tRNA (adenosine(37)-N6)-threonylcarbamoyltransferase complex ATPase subunit type 1 TsaE [Elusimicrobiota bacterium]